MGTNPTSSRPLRVDKRFPSDQDVDRAILRIQRLITDVVGLEQVRLDDGRVAVVEEQIHRTVQEVFGADSNESRRQGQLKLAKSGMEVFFSTGYDQGDFDDRVRTVKEILKNLVRDLEEMRSEPCSHLGSGRGSLDDGALHPAIRLAAMSTYRNGHYREAVVNAAIALSDLVRARSGLTDLDGVALMQQVFSGNSPTLAFSEGPLRADEDKQTGMMRLFEGAIFALRNPRAHTLDQDSPDDARDILVFLSFLARCVDRAKKVKGKAGGV